MSSGAGNVSASSVARRTTGSAIAHRPGRDDEPIDLLVDRRRHRGMVVAERRDRDPVGEVEVGRAGRVVQAVTLAVAPAPLEVATEHGGEVVAGEGLEIERGVVLAWGSGHARTSS